MLLKLQMLADIYDKDVLGPNCATLSPKPNETQTRRALKGKERGFSFSWPSQKPHHQQEWWCKVSKTNINLFFVLVM